MRISTACCGSIVENPLAQYRRRRVNAVGLSWGRVVVNGSLLRGGRAINTNFCSTNMAWRSIEEGRKEKSISLRKKKKSISGRLSWANALRGGSVGQPCTGSHIAPLVESRKQIFWLWCGGRQDLRQEEQQEVAGVMLMRTVFRHALNNSNWCFLTYYCLVFKFCYNPPTISNLNMKL